MDCLTYSPIDTIFDFTSNDSSFSLTMSESVSIPFQSNVNYREMSYKLMKSNKIPVFLEKQMIQNFKDFVDQQMDKFQDQRVDQLMSESSVLSDSLDLSSLRDHRIDAKYKSIEEHNESKDNNQFYHMYHQLIHSGIFTESLMKFETSYSDSIQNLIKARDHSYQDLISRQSQEMEEAVQQIGTVLDEQCINSLSIKHFEESEKMKDTWNETIGRLKAEQRQEFHQWINKVYEDFRNGNPESIATNLKCLSMESNDFSQVSSDSFDWTNSFNDEQNPMEESFTINLGAQLKTTHNLRLISMDILDLCRLKSDHHFDRFSPQRIQTAMSLYSHSLSAMVLLVDNRINSYSGIKQDFAKICQKSTEFHFADLDTQLEVNRQMMERLSSESDPKKVLQTGDFYVTKHSNLSQIHVVFHLVCDDSLRSSEINSRHPVILGLRNIMKICHLNDISNITIPLLLIHEMTEDITIQWCLKRAELVLKCVKGFMIEMASLSSTCDENRTVQFVVPKGISQELFSNLTTILPSIFRLSNPLVLRSSYDFE